MDALRPELDRLIGSQISEFLYALAMVDARHQLDTVRMLIAQCPRQCCKSNTIRVFFNGCIKPSGGGFASTIQA